MTRRILIHLACLTAAATFPATAATFTLFSDTFEGSNGPGNPPTQWEAYPSNTPSTRFWITPTSAGYNGPSAPGTQCLGGNSAQWGRAKMRTTSTSWNAVPAGQTVESYTTRFDFQNWAAGDMAQLVLGADSSLLGGYLITGTNQGNGNTYFSLSRVTAWNDLDTLPSTANLDTKTYAEAITNFNGVWQTMTVTMTPSSNGTTLLDLTMTSANATRNFSFTDTSTDHLTTLSTLGMVFYTQSSALGPLADNFSVTASTIPEPAALTVLGAGLLFGLRRRRVASTRAS